MGYFPEEVNYNKRIEELFNKIMNKKLAKCTSISPRNNKIINKDNPDLNENNLNINNNSEKNLNHNSLEIIIIPIFLKIIQIIF